MPLSGELELPAESVLRAWCLALRDLCELGAERATVTIGGAQVVYRPGCGARVVRDGHEPVDLTEEWIDYAGLVPA